MYACLKGRGLIAFSDPAGAKACLGLATLLKSQNNTIELTLVSNKEYDFYKDWDLSIEIDKQYDFRRLAYKPDWIFTGTSHPESSGKFEIGFLKFARQFTIPSWSFVDHWTSIMLRFLDDEGPVFPKKIVVLDSRAEFIAIQEGVPGELLYIHTNPYIDYIKNIWKPKLTAQQISGLLNLQSCFRKTILYAPDPLSLRNEDMIWGFNEGTVLEEILTITQGKKDIAILIKTHPLQPKGVLEEVIQKNVSLRIPQVTFVANIDNLEIIHFADLIIGFHSNFLLEADALGKDIIRYFPKSISNDPLSHLEIGIRVNNLRDLSDLIESKLEE